MEQEAALWIAPLDGPEEQAEEFEQGTLLSGGALGLVTQHRYVVEVPQPRGADSLPKCVVIEGEPFALNGHVQQ
jgi:hypothetical protein